MKKNILLLIFLLSAASAFATRLPPYGDSFDNPFQEESLDIKMYPNPVTDGRLTIKSSESFNLIQILNITGEVVYNQEFPSGSTSENIEVTKLEKGMYLVRIRFEGKPNFTGKIIVK